GRAVPSSRRQLRTCSPSARPRTLRRRVGADTGASQQTRPRRPRRMTASSPLLSRSGQHGSGSAESSANSRIHPDPAPGAHTHPRKQSPVSTEVVTSARTVARADNEGWSLYGAPWLQPVAISGKGARADSAENKPKLLPWVATGCREEVHGK